VQCNHRPLFSPSVCVPSSQVSRYAPLRFPSRVLGLSGTRLLSLSLSSPWRLRFSLGNADPSPASDLSKSDSMELLPALQSRYQKCPNRFCPTHRSGMWPPRQSEADYPSGILTRPCSRMLLHRVPLLLHNVSHTTPASGGGIYKQMNYVQTGSNRTFARNNKCLALRADLYSFELPPEK